MAKFYGPVGYGEPEEKSPGVYEDKITEKMYYGDILKNSRQFKGTDKINNDISIANPISIIADAYSMEHIFAIRYIKWAGVYWKVAEVIVQHPRLLLRLGEVYNGQKAGPSS